MLRLHRLAYELPPLALAAFVVAAGAHGCGKDSDPSPSTGAAGAGGGGATSTGGDTGGASTAGATTSGGTSTAGSGGGGASGSTGSTVTGASGGAGSGGSTGTGGAAGGGSGSAADVARRLGRKANFLIGMGNDVDQSGNHDKDGAYTLGVTLDLHYLYLVGGSFPWTKWNTDAKGDGALITIMCDAAKKHGVAPMFSLYSMASRTENDPKVLVDDSFMKPYWDQAKILFERLGAFNEPALAQLEPDWWGFAQQAGGGDPTKVPAHIGSLAPDCKGLPENVAGMGKCLVALGHKYAPKTLLAFHASRWANGDPAKIASYLVQVGGDESDLVTTDTLDRDAGCFEAKLSPECTRNDGPWYWDETNKTSPNFHEHLAWAKTLSQGMGKPILWWQTPFGVPSSTPGGEAYKFRDNRVKYIFEHVDEFIAAGGVGAAFGMGADKQTYITSDGGQFKNAVTKYFAAPTPLP